MSFIQRVIPCPDDHDECEVIECVNSAGERVWVSHAHNSTHAECRANPDYPLKGGDATKPLCEYCTEHFARTT